MAKKEIYYTEHLDKTLETLSKPGILIVSNDETGKANPMTIGWGTLGVVWGRPVFEVLVRPSRHTHELLRDAKTFSVNVPTDKLAKACALCGSRSGRDTDKIAETGLTVEPGMELDVPTIKECPVHYECRILHVTEMDGARLDKGVADSFYANGDLHTIYHGEVVGVFKQD